MNDWTCQICGNTIRDRLRAPGYCPRCGLGYFIQAAERSESSVYGISPISLDPACVQLNPPVPAADAQQWLFPTIPAARQSRRGGQPAKRVRPREPLQVRLAWSASLQALNISATGLLVEDIRPFTPGWMCDVELRRSDRMVQLPGEVARCCVVSGRRGGRTGLRFHTGVRFLEVPQTFYSLIPELSEEA